MHIALKYCTQTLMRSNGNMFPQTFDGNAWGACVLIKTNSERLLIEVLVFVEFKQVLVGFGVHLGVLADL
jgi:hypothetical protein